LHSVFYPFSPHPPDSSMIFSPPAGISDRCSHISDQTVVVWCGVVGSAQDCDPPLGCVSSQPTSPVQGTQSLAQLQSITAQPSHGRDKHYKEGEKT